MGRRTFAAALVVLGACSVRAPGPAPSHPANAAATIGRLAGAPPSLRPGGVAYPDVPAIRDEPKHDHQHHAP